MVMEENTFLMKVAYDDVLVKVKVTSNLELLSNVNVMFNLPCISFLLEVVQSLIKFNKLHDAFMYGFVIVMKICQKDLYAIYFDPNIAFKSSIFLNGC
jgi:hypothetical protein